MLGRTDPSSRLSSFVKRYQTDLLLLCRISVKFLQLDVYHEIDADLPVAYMISLRTCVYVSEGKEGRGWVPRGTYERWR